jgi:hypothetical protein
MVFGFAGAFVGLDGLGIALQQALVSIGLSVQTAEWLIHPVAGFVARGRLTSAFVLESG